MRISSSLPAVIISIGLTGAVAMTAIAWPSLVAEKAQAASHHDVLAYPNIDATPAVSRFSLETTSESHVIGTIVVERATPDSQPTAYSVAPATASVREQSARVMQPARLSIPSAGMDKHIIAVGVNAKNEMDVPDGDTDLVGWYRGSATPGAAGVAIMDAHVFAAFENLKHVRVGADIYVTDASGAEQHFRVTNVTTYRLSELSPRMLFTGKGSSGRYLNLITCAGTYIDSAGTYDHRLIVFAELVS